MATFTPENYIQTIAKETKTTEIEVFHNFVLNQKLIVTASRNASYLIITVVIFRGVLRICELVIIELFGTAVVQNNSFMVAVVTYPLCFIITNQFCLVTIKFIKLNLYVVFYTVKYSVIMVRKIGLMAFPTPTEPPIGNER